MTTVKLLDYKTNLCYNISDYNLGSFYMKNCSKCHALKSFDNFYLHKNIYSSWCKECTRNQVNQYRKNNTEKVKQRKKDYYENNKERILQKNQEYRDNNPRDYSEEYKRYLERVGIEQYRKECRERSKKYRENNREKINKKARDFRNANIEKAIKKNRLYREIKGEKLLERRRELYYEDYERHLNYKRTRDAIKKLHTPSWANLEKINSIYKECYEMNKKEGRKKYAVDHIIPLRANNVSGLHYENNLRIICYKENSRKQNKLEE